MAKRFHGRALTRAFTQAAYTHVGWTNVPFRRRTGRSIVRSVKTRILVYVAGALVALLIGAALFVPMLLDTTAISADIQQRVSAELDAELRWQDFRLRVLP